MCIHSMRILMHTYTYAYIHTTHTGEVGAEMYIIDSGRIEIVNEATGGHFTFLGEGDVRTPTRDPKPEPEPKP